MTEPIVSLEAIRDLARKAAATDRPVYDANPYPESSAAHRHFECEYWACVREIEQMETA